MMIGVEVPAQMVAVPLSLAVGRVLTVTIALLVKPDALHRLVSDSVAI